MDGSYRSQPDPHQVPYSSSYDARSYDPSSYQPDASFREPQRPRSPPPSNTANDGYAQPNQQPLYNALNNAFDKSDSAGQVDPEIIAQITAEVKRSVLDEIKLGMCVTAQPQQPVAPPQQPYPPQSPISTTSIPSRNVYTPPSPKHAALFSQGSASPDPLSHDPLFDGAGDTPTTRHQRIAPVDIPHERSIPRPTAPLRMTTDSDLTPIERRWQHLFDPQGQPTPRLGEFLRGLAIHLVGNTARDPITSLTQPDR
jgi:hypothetical protein